MTTAPPLKTVRDRYSEDEIASFYAAGHWQSSSFYGLLSERARDTPDASYVFDSTTRLSYGECAERALRLAVGLQRLGVRRGERVAVQLPNWTEFPLVAAALSRIGAILVPIMPIYRDDEVRYVLRHSGAVAVITCAEFRGFDHARMFDRLRADCQDLRQIFVARADDGASLDATHLDDVEVLGDPVDLAAEAGPDSAPDDGFLIVYTSGTTSRPKGCFHTFNTLRASAAAIAASVRYGPADVQFGPSPITHGTGIVTSLALPLLVGAKSYLMEVWDPEEALRRIERYGCTAAVTATSFLQMLMAAYDPNKHDASSLRLWICAGSPIPGAIVQKSRELFAGCQTLSLYGRSENFLTTMCTLDDPPERSAASDGRSLAGAAVRIVDESGNELPRGEEGDIAYRGPSHMIEYFRDETETAALFTPDGFSRSGDLGRMDVDGYVRVTGRLKDIVIRGGMNISAREIEEHLAGHPAVAAVAVVGMPDERLGERACAYVVPSHPAAPPTLADLTVYLREQQVAVQKLPERLELISAMPTTATGKIQKHLLRADIAAKLS